MLIIVFYSIVSHAQITEPEFIGDVYWQKQNGEVYMLEKEIAAYTTGTSFKYNTWNALFLEVSGARAKTIIPINESIKFIVRALDNNSDPMSIITIYRFECTKNKRKTILAEDNSGTLMKSRTHTKNQIVFRATKYGSSSYLISIADLEEGEYGITVVNPNNRDEKKTIISCFGVYESICK